MAEVPEKVTQGQEIEEQTATSRMSCYQPRGKIVEAKKSRQFHNLRWVEEMLGMADMGRWTARMNQCLDTFSSAQETFHPKNKIYKNS